MPLQVVAGFLLSLRGMSDSGVWGMNGIVWFIFLVFRVLLMGEIERFDSK